MPSRTPAPPTNRNNQKQSPIPVVSRTMPIVNPDGTVTRSGQLLLEQLQAPGTTYGSHADRPDPGSVTDGAVYIEFDRGSVYQNQDGVWQYITGTMWATLNPDLRPTDLGTHDGGFDFRTTDQPAREFIWSQTEWIEATPVRYGTHAQRLAVVVAAIIDQTLWVETDRGAIYQLQNGTTWQYLAGTMWGTLSPDQRPTDLGTHDAGFDFRGTDQQREFIWSQTAWVETTSISGGANLTHANVVTKVGTAGQIVEGGITDLSAGNSGSVNITAAGNVGIGTGSPTTRLDVKQNVTPRANVTFLNASAPATGNKMRLRLGPTNGFENSDIYPYVEATCEDGPSQNAGIALGTYAGALNERVRITAGGQVGIGLSAPTFFLQLASDSAAKPSTSTWSVVSDLRLKQNIKPLKDDSLSILNKLEWIRFEYNGLANMPRGEKAIGLAAQELLLQLPEAVCSTKTKLNETDAEETDVMAIDYHHIIVHSARAIQQLNAEVQALRALIGKP